MYRVALVCEGPVDRIIIEAALDHYLDDYEPLPVQPPSGCLGGHSGPFGGGWKGVRTWCMQEAQGPGGLSTILANADLLVIQVDADVALDPEVGLARPCPPPSENADAVRALVLQWLGRDDVPASSVLCVPAMCSETWALAALFPDDAAVVGCDPPPEDGVCLECRTDVKALLRTLGKRMRPKLVVLQKGEPKNQAAGYRAQQGRLTAGWGRVLEACGEAVRFGEGVGALRG